MRNEIVESPNLFDTIPQEGVVPDPAPANSVDRLARDFVRWLFSFGADFRNSPDMTNLRFWLQKQGVEIKDGEDREIAIQARVLFAKKLEQLMRKPEAKPPGA